jgi:hypothetical protein
LFWPLPLFLIVRLFISSYLLNIISFVRSPISSNCEARRYLLAALLHHLFFHTLNLIRRMLSI